MAELNDGGDANMAALRDHMQATGRFGDRNWREERIAAGWGRADFELFMHHAAALYSLHDAARGRHDAGGVLEFPVIADAPGGGLRLVEALTLDLDRPGLTTAGRYVFLLPCRSGGSTSLLHLHGDVDPLTKRGKLRKSFVLGWLRFATAEHGSEWWAWRARDAAGGLN